MRNDREPWLAVNLSFIQSGLGQIYAGLVGWGSFLLITDLALFFYAAWNGFTQNGNIRFAIGLAVCWVGLRIYNLFDAYSAVKSRNVVEFESKRRKVNDSWLGVLLNQAFPGIGSLYARQWISAIVFLALGVCLYYYVIPWIEDSSLEPMPILVLTFLMVSGLRCLSMIHSYIHSKHRREKTFQLIIIVVLCFFVEALKSDLARRVFMSKFDHFSIDSTAKSNLPTLQAGDEVWVKIQSNYVAKRGDIVLYYIQKNGKAYPNIHRVAGKSGEKIMVKSTGQLMIDGMAYAREPFKSMSYAVRGRFGTNGLPYRVPQASVYVLGDNSHLSVDSRFFGAIQESDVVGVLVKRIWPIDRVGDL